MAFSAVGDDLMLVLSAHDTPSESEWLDYARALEELVRPLRAAARPLKVLVFADEAGPNAKQRAAIADTLHGLHTRTAVLSNSVIARNLITAFGWLNFSIKGFAPTNLAGAAHFLELSPERLAQVMNRAIALAPSVGGVRCLEIAVGTTTNAAHMR